MDNKSGSFIPSIIFSVAFLIGIIIFVSVWSSNRNADQTITVTGSAKKEITSDLGILRGTINVQSKTAGDAYRELQRQKPVLLDYLNSKGFPQDQVEFFTVNGYPIYEFNANGYQTNIINGYIYNQRIEIRSEDVNRIKDVSLEIASIIEKGISFMVEMPEYHYTKIADLKIEIQAEAARDAKVRAEKIAEATDRSLGTIRSARMGVIQITPKLSNAVSDYGINDLSSIEKEITAVVNASFKID
jgi:uncharacterized protein